MNQLYTFKIFPSAESLPETWNMIASDNIFLTQDYMRILERSAPDNMECHFIGIFEDEALVGIALSQFLDIDKLESFGERDRCLKSSIRNLIFKRFSSHVLLIGNNMLTGQNAFAFVKDIFMADALKILRLAVEELRNIFRKKGKKVHLTTFKDFDQQELGHFQKAGFENYLQFSTQPNMVFTIQKNWKSEQDYIDALSKKYRDQYKRARKKNCDIQKCKMNLEDIILHEDTIYELYFHVAKNAPFNTFFLNKKHFSTFKEILKDKFLFYGYFIEDKLIGFNTLIKNGNVMDTYFLGYDDGLQKEKMLYLNMLYDMIAYSINKGFEEIIFARTALEIKSSVGAKPQQMFGFMQHSNNLINKNLEYIFKYLEPETLWQERNPFKEISKSESR